MTMKHLTVAVCMGAVALIAALGGYFFAKGGFAKDDQRSVFDEADRGAGKVTFKDGAPDFVIDREDPPFEDLTPQQANGVQNLLYDMQHDATDRTYPQYVRQVFRAVNATGAQQMGQYSVMFDPLFQTVEINHLRVIRGGTVSDRSKSYTVTYAQREALADMQILTGLTTGIITIDDISTDDVLDVALTIRGNSPSFGNKESRVFPLTSAAEVGLFSWRSTWPGAVRISDVFGFEAPLVVKSANKTVVEITPRPLEALNFEEAMRVPNTLFGSVVLSNFGGWNHVADWARKYYAPIRDQAVREIADDIVANNSTQAEQAVAALRYAQNEIRYSAQLLGKGGYQPQDLSETLRSRSGDCKAKTVLLLSLFDQLGIKASAALANTLDGLSIDYLPPTPLAFNHVLVRFEVGGKKYWADPTLLHQGGSLDSMSQPNYGLALVLDDYALGLTDMAAADDTLPAMTITEEFDLIAGAEPGSITSAIVYRREAADMLREMLANFSEEDLLSSVTGYYSRYGGVETLQSSVVDDIAANTVTIDFTLSLESPFGKPKESGRKYFNFEAHAIPSVLFAKLDDDNPPLARVPAMSRLHIVHDIEISLPRDIDWSLEPMRESISNDVFDFSAASRQEDGKLIYSAEMRPKKWAIEPEIYASVAQDDDDAAEARKQHIWMAEDSARSLKPEFDIKIMPTATFAPDSPAEPQ